MLFPSSTSHSWLDGEVYGPNLARTAGKCRLRCTTACLCGVSILSSSDQLASRLPLGSEVKAALLKFRLLRQICVRCWGGHWVWQNGRSTII